MSDVDLEDYGFETTPYDAWVAYGRSKTANALFAVAFDRRHADQGVHAYSVHPGGIHTELARHLTDETLGALRRRLESSGRQFQWKTIPQGAATSVWAATAAELDSSGGHYLEDCGVAEITDEAVLETGVRAYAQDPRRAPRRCGSCRSASSLAERCRTAALSRRTAGRSATPGRRRRRR